LHEKFTRIKKKEERKSDFEKSKIPLAQKLKWFKAHLDSQKEAYTPTDINSIIEQYLQRLDGEITLLHNNNSKYNKNDSKTTKIDVLTISLKSERNLYETTGFDVPDLLDTENLKVLRNWNGDIKTIYQIKTIAVSKSSLVDITTEQNKQNEMAVDQ